MFVDERQNSQTRTSKLNCDPRTEKEDEFVNDR